MPKPKRTDTVREARFLARSRQWSQLWWMILRLPVVEAVRASRYLKPRKWLPPGEADAELAGLLAAADSRAAARVLDTVLSATTRTVPKWLSSMPSPTGFSHREPVAALNTTRRHDIKTSEIVTVDRGGLCETLYQGPASHWSIACVDRSRVVARREFFNDVRGDTEVVLYTPGSENVLISGEALLDANVETTANGFVVGLKMLPIAIAEADGLQEEIDLSEYGLRLGCQFAVDPTGTRIAFVEGDRILVTDSRLRPLHWSEPPSFSIRDNRMDGVSFIGDSIVTTDIGGKRIQLWKIIGDRIRGVGSSSFSTPRGLFGLFPVGAWNLLVGEGGNENFFFDATTLDQTRAPAFLGGPQRVVGSFSCAPYAKLAVYAGSLFPVHRQDVSGLMTTVVHDLRHPLNVVAKPLVSLGAADAQNLRAALDTSAVSGGYDLSEEARELLALTMRAAELRPELVTA